MQKTKYLIRLDDACPYMDRAKWQRMEDILDKYGVKPLVGIIPANADPKTMVEPEDLGFWAKAHSWEKKGWSIALHGYDHVCISNEGMSGINPIWRRSEFAGVPIQLQREKIRLGYSLLKEKGLNPDIFFAPSHTFDNNTLEALKLETNIRIISDTIGRYPYNFKDFVFIPQFSGHCVKVPLGGIYTFCFHPNTMTEFDFINLNSFVKQNARNFSSFNIVDINCIDNKRIFDKFLSWAYFLYRKIRKLY